MRKRHLIELELVTVCQEELGKCVFKRLLGVITKIPLQKHE